ncbi:MAG: hypothetical protein IPK86_01205 [Neisseriales bacterium]|nr:MAG: hypothetical protein IPK86_01205 [Neisseriales bacterium]
MNEVRTEPYLTINLGSETEIRVFNNEQELNQWLSSILEEWRWLAEISDPLGISYTPASDAWNRIQREVNTAISNIHNPEVIKNHLENLFSNYAWLSTKNAQRNFIDNWCMEGKKFEASIIAAYLLGENLDLQNLNRILPVLIEFCLVEQGFTESNRAKISLGQIKNRLLSDLNKSLKLYEQQSHKFTELKANLTAKTIQQDQNFQAAESERRIFFEQQLKKIKDDFQNLEAIYNTELATKAPVIYWRKKCKTHCWFMGGIILLLGSGIIALLCGIEEIAAIIKSVADIVGSSPTMVIAIYITIITIILWLIRLLTKLLLSQIHLWNNAYEKITMCQAYLAMLRNKSFNESGSNHMEIIFSALFRPSGDGIAKDDEVPLTAVDWITKFLKK